MTLQIAVPKRKLLWLLVGTLLLQVIFLGFSLYYRRPSPTVENQLRLDRQAQRAINTAGTVLAGFGSAAEQAKSTSSELSAAAIHQEVTSNIERALGQDQDLQEIIHKVKPGDTLSGIWRQYGSTIQDANEAAKALKQSGEGFGTLRSGEEVLLMLDESDNSIQSMRRTLPDRRSITLVRQSDGNFRVEIAKPAVVEKPRTVSGSIFNSFAETAHTHEIPYGVIDTLVDLFGSRLEFTRDVQPGDTFSVTYLDRKTKRGDVLLPGPIKLASIMNDGELLVAVRYKGKNGESRYYNEKGEPVGNYFLRYPVQFSRISSVFSTSRFHPVLKRSRPHNGVDFAAPIGTPVRAVADGVVVDAGFKGHSGRMVKIKHGSRYSTAYLHLSRIDSKVHRGAQVNRGQVIGAVGMTGLATGPHLHFSLYDYGRYVDPLSVNVPLDNGDVEKLPDDVLQKVLDTINRRHEQVQVALAAQQTQSQG